MNQLTVAEVSRRLGLSLSATYRRLAVNGGPIRCYRMGFGPHAPIRVSERDVERYLDSCFRQPAPEPQHPERMANVSDFETARIEVLRGKR